MGVDHYENFPVASRLMPAAIRTDVINVYRFARYADDVADEGDASPTQRIAHLRRLLNAIHCIAQSQTGDVHHALHHAFSRDADAPLLAVCLPLAQTIKQQKLPIKPFTDLLSAFEQDVQVKRYAHMDLLRDYCARSANPIGRLMLHLFKHHDPQSLEQSDHICTALQLINFLQDVAIDYQKGRIYLPLDEMQTFGVRETDLATGHVSDAWRHLMHFQVNRCRDLITAGAPLSKSLRGRFAFELKLIIQGGSRILDKIQAVDYDVFHQRPTLKPFDWWIIFWRALRS